MRRFLGGLVLCAVATPAFAHDYLSLAGPSNHNGNGGGVANTDTYRLPTEDGSSENSVGLTAGGNLAWMNRFTVSGGNNIITAVSFALGSPSFPGSSGAQIGTPFTVYVWDDLNNDGTPDNNALLASANGNVAIAPDTDSLQKVAINAVVPGGNGKSFFVGVSINQAAGTFPASLDQTLPNGGQSWVCGSGTQGGFNPNNLTGGIGLFNMDAIGLAGDWLVRANAVPEPTTLALFGLLSLGLIRRR